MDLSGHMRERSLSSIPILQPTSNEAQVNQLGPQTKPGINTNRLENSTPSLSPSPKFREPPVRPPTSISKDDSTMDPSTPRRPAFAARGLSLQMPPKGIHPFNIGSAYSRIPLSPKLDPADSYAGSPVIPRRSRGLDFARAATNLHHSMLAESSLDSSPTINGRAINIPGRRKSQLFGEPPHHWGSRPNGDRTTVSSSLGSINMLCSDSSDSSSDEDMDADDIDDSILTTPQIGSRLSAGLDIWTTQAQPNGLANTGGGTPSNGLGFGTASNWMNSRSTKSSNNLMNFRRSRARDVHHSRTKKHSSSSSSMASPMSRSPPGTGKGVDARRESISWAANQLHIDGSESEDGLRLPTLDTIDSAPTTPARESRGGVVKRAVTRRGNMLPKTKGFARIRAALAEESCPVETELRSEATVIKQTRENDMEIETPRPKERRESLILSSPMNVPLHSPMIGPTQPQPSVEGEPFDAMNPPQSASFKFQALKNEHGVKQYWDGCQDRNNSSLPLNFLNRESTSMSTPASGDEMSIDSPQPSAFGQRTFSMASNTSLQGNIFSNANTNPDNLTDFRSLTFQGLSASPSRASTPAPAPINIRSVNNKRRRDDDFDPMSFKRRAVSPGMAASVQNSPILRSPMQMRADGSMAAWAPRSGERGIGGMFGEVGAMGEKNGPHRTSNQGRVGLKGMTDTNDGLMKMSIE